ncbi:putative sulfoacetate transporter SauU [Paenibacillus konkukensis]|uniref:Sulfoacetate transporter SauU n=1 Tax=Paenibacillus konkukensis TaxID=2020716 RepID=A0ABY4RKM3_9BACL|nr:putative sulfoacetate transporter SauU [Paenibacillus konkukensis]
MLGITKDLGLSASATGVLLSSFFAGYALMQIPGGYLADRFGYRNVILISVLMWSVFTVLTGSAWSLTSMIVIRFLFGIGEGGYFPSGSKALASWFPQNERSRAMSFMLASGAIMGVITPILSTHLMTSVGWRSMFYMIGACGIVITLLLFFFLKERKADALPGMATEQAAVKPKAPLKTVLKTPMIWNLFLAYFSVYAINWGLNSWMPTYLVKARGLDMTSVGYLSAIPAFVGIFGMLLSGYILDKLPAGKDRLAAGILALVTGGLLYLMGSASSIPMFIAYQCLVGVFFAFISTLIASASLKSMPAELVGSANGFINTGAQVAGVLTPMLIGFMVDAFGGSYNAAFIMLVAFAALCAGALFTARAKPAAFSGLQARTAAYEESTGGTNI